ncbi:hypothetical protein JAAARDRAFT_62629 [Jaapia argillacea MUCL 33604]|uniref:Uncharacterized protein n=1 Tax=Jaapia argillacea MUCL 33604 TaxID=933084 RepID=A0A067PL73_9AGAM|nr:hypothetical protein JAAARDRAFT_62629 [Jaapia argillacea MUCL 33604]
MSPRKVTGLNLVTCYSRTVGSGMESECGSESALGVSAFLVSPRHLPPPRTVLHSDKSLCQHINTLSHPSRLTPLATYLSLTQSRCSQRRKTLRARIYAIDRENAGNSSREGEILDSTFGRILSYYEFGTRQVGFVGAMRWNLGCSDRVDGCENVLSMRRDRMGSRT